MQDLTVALTEGRVTSSGWRRRAQRLTRPVPLAELLRLVDFRTNATLAEADDDAEPQRQLALPLREGWPEQRPVLTRGGQYRLPIELPRRPRQPAAEPPTPLARTRVGSHQLLLLHRSGRIPHTIRRPGKATS